MCGRAADRVLVLDRARELAEAGAFERDDLLGVVRERRAVEQHPDVGRALDDPRVRLGLEQEGVEVAVVAEQRLRGHRGAQVHDERELARVVGGEHGEAGHERRAVGEREPFLGFQLERRQAELGQHVGRFTGRALVEHLGLADQRATDVGERDQITGRAARATLRDQRQDVVVEQRQQLLDQFATHARVALRQTVGAEEHRQARHLGRGDLPGAGAQEPQHVLLQLGGLLRRDLAVRAVAEPGRDAVDRDLAGDQVFLERSRRLDAAGRPRSTAWRGRRAGRTARHRRS